MKLNSINLPQVSDKFYEQLIRVFPPLDPLDININTNMIEIQRSAAQQEVIQYIKQAVRKEVDNTTSLKPKTLLERIKYVLTN